MVKSGNMSSAVPPPPHTCGWKCLGPLTFHPQAVGSSLCLSEGGRLAEKTAHTFKNGLVFSSRQVAVKEKIRLRVERDVVNWHGALRVGFTTVPPSARPLPLPCMAIPDLTNCPGHWAAVVDEYYCQAGSELEFWVTSSGAMYVTRNNSNPRMLLKGVDLSQPLWAMIDIYGQTCSVYLMGSRKKTFLHTSTSCPAPERLTSPNADNPTPSAPGVSNLCGNSNDDFSSLDRVPAEDVCVVCMGKEARIFLPCGHRCLCEHCASRIIQQFGTCPLCRHQIRAPSEGEVEEQRVSWVM